MSKLTAQILHPSALEPADGAAWRTLQAATPAFGSPLLAPDFAEAVGAVRKDARVAIWRAACGAPKAFLAFHERPDRFARPIGAPFCDYHAVISADDFDLDGSAVLASARLKALRLNGLIDPFGLFDRTAYGASPLTRETAYRIVLGAGSQATVSADAGLVHLDILKASSANRFKNFRRYSKRLEQAFGPLRLVALETDRAAFEQLLDWKRRQLHRTGLHDFLRPAWVGELMQRLFKASVDSEATSPNPSPDDRFGGLMISLYAGDHHVASHFGVRLGGWFHPWIGATAPNLEAHGAGFVHQWKAVEAMGSLGLHTYDLGAGSDHWKRLFASDVVEVGTGLITAPTFGGCLARAGDRLWTTPPLDRIGLARRLHNRLDQIATIETGWSGRARGVLAMASALERRTASRRADVGDAGQEAPAPSLQPLSRPLS